MTAAIELADKWLSLTRLERTVYTGNLPAIQLYKSGLVCEATHRQYAFQGGVFVDTYTVTRLVSA